MDSTVSKQVALLKFKDALDALAEHKAQARIVFAPDIIRDVGLSEPEGKDLALELSGREKDRLGGFSTFMRGGGHAMLGANAAMALRGLLTEAVDVGILAKVYPKDRWELVTQYLVNNPAERGIAPANAEFVLNDRTNPKRQAVNIVLARKKYTTIILGEQPKLSLADYAGKAKKNVLELLGSADIVAVLSLKSKFMDEVLGLCERHELVIPELFCDCTSGDDMELNYRMLDTLRRKGASGSSAINLLSINENEVLLFEMLLRREAERKEITEASSKKSRLVAELDKEKGSKDKEAEILVQIGDANDFVEKGQMENPFEAARVLYEKIGVPLLVHTKEGACIVGGDKSTNFVPSVEIDFPKGSSFVGAGDTLCGALATALAVKQKSDALLPGDRRLSYGDCLLIANIATGYRLAKVNRVGKQPGNKEWYEATGKIAELYEWISAMPMKGSVDAALPGKISFIDVEASSTSLCGFSCMDSETLLAEVRKKCETEYWTARTAFEGLCGKREHMGVLVELVKDAGPAGGLFGKKAIRALAEQGNVGVDALVEAISSMDEECACTAVLESVANLSNTKMAAEIIFRVLCTGRLADSFGKLTEQIAPTAFGRHVDHAVENVAKKPDFIAETNTFRRLFMKEPTKSRLVGQGVDIDLIYRLGLLAQKACLELDAAAKETASRLSKRIGMDNGTWDKFKKEMRRVLWEGDARLMAWEDPDPPTREMQLKKYGISSDVLNNAMIVPLFSERDWQHWYLWQMEEWVTPPYTEPVRDLLMWHNEKRMRTELSNTGLSDEFYKNMVVDSAVRSFYKKLLAICLVGKLINPEITPFYDENNDETLDAPNDFYGRRADDITKVMSKWPQEQPRADTAARAARECSRRERDHFMEPAHNRRMHKRRFEAAPERMNRMKRIV
jgi:sugar/nucleoside kinase (ribokinase family)